MTTPPPYPGPYLSAPPDEPPLWLPHYGCSLQVAVKRFVRKYAVFHGRASRAEFWWLYLAYVIVFFGLVIVGMIAGIPGSSMDSDGTWEPGPGFVPFGMLITLLMLGTIVPSISVTVRRLHDVDLSGWLFLICLVPYLGGLALFVLTLLPPKPAGARFDRPETPVPVM